MKSEEVVQSSEYSTPTGYTVHVSAPNARKVPLRTALNPESRDRRATAAALAVVSAIAIACAFGPQWAQYLGLALVIGALALSTWHSWREIDRLTAEHAAIVKAMRAQAKAAAHAHHEEQMAMIERFASRTRAQREQYEELQATLAELEAELADERAAQLELRAELGESRTEVAEGHARIASLEKLVAQVTQQLEATTAELEELQAASPDAEVLHMPRRVSKPSDEGIELAQRRQA